MLESLHWEFICLSEKIVFSKRNNFVIIYWGILLPQFLSADSAPECSFWDHYYYVIFDSYAFCKEENSKLESQIEKLQTNIDALQTDLNQMNQSSSGFEQELNKVRKALESEQKKCTDMETRVEELGK